MWGNADGRGITKYKFPPSRRYATYSLLNTSCTTFVCDALKYAYQEEMPWYLENQNVPLQMDTVLRISQTRGNGIVK